MQDFEGVIVHFLFTVLYDKYIDFVFVYSYEVNVFIHC
jgi:hypothetical protein